MSQPSEIVTRVAAALYVRVRQRNEGPFGNLPGAEEAYREDWDGKLNDSQRESYMGAAEAAINAMPRPAEGAKQPKWQPIETAPLNECGHLWSPQYPDHVEATGSVYAYDDGGRGISSTWQGVTFTHWHAFPSPPTITG